jgi:hypothetical protein
MKILMKKVIRNTFVVGSIHKSTVWERERMNTRLFDVFAVLPSPFLGTTLSAIEYQLNSAGPPWVFLVKNTFLMLMFLPKKTYFHLCISMCLVLVRLYD